MHKFVLTATAGLEEICEKEAKRIGAKPLKRHLGRVIVEAPLDFVYRGNYELRSVGKVYLLLAEGKARDLDEVKEIAEKVDLWPYISGQETFGVKTTRIGEHPFTSIDISAAIGEVIKRNHGLRVYLDDPDLPIKAWMIGEEVTIGLNTSGESLHKRKYRIFSHPAPLKGNIASSLIFLSDWRSEETLLDPMCGSGTILIEAAMLGRNIPPGKFRKMYQFFRMGFFDDSLWREYVRERDYEIEWRKKMKIFGIDISKKHLSSAFGNACKAKVADTIGLILGDARRLSKEFRREFEVLITNPPYGIRMGRPKYVRELYHLFCQELRRCFSGRIGVIITAEKLMGDLLMENFKVLEKKVFYGSLPTYIFVFS